MKTTFDGILQEANRLSIEQELAEQSRVLKLELLQLGTQFERGTISEDVYSREEKRIMRELGDLSRLAKSSGARI